MQENIREYDKGFYGRCIKKYGNFARDVAPILINAFQIKSAVDIGCGAGMYIKGLHDKGVDVVGYEGNQTAKICGLLPEKVIVHDVRKPLKFDRKFDLCMCVEVAEHIPEEKSSFLIETLCRASDTVLFTAAKIGQSGTQHVNCQNEDYWILAFLKFGYWFDRETRDNLRKEIEKLPSFRARRNFFYNNLMIFRAKRL